ncbi:hypothetical protein UYSO10_1879 [Kosakonia radicincitans]|nr:hypothetical protein UYSO10_1879 [Kosakonia radicincitans]
MLINTRTYETDPDLYFKIITGRKIPINNLPYIYDRKMKIIFQLNDTII